MHRKFIDKTFTASNSELQDKKWGKPLIVNVSLKNWIEKKYTDNNTIQKYKQFDIDKV